MASKIFCCCCPAGEGPSTTTNTYNPRMSQEHRPRTFDLNTSRQNSRQRRHPPHYSVNGVLKACTLASP
ncbi:testis expressed 53 [Phyllostomus discolor]|uniref:Testis expressed 53 n=1 Tax=Phyllostomus discolor TaxID=89673 RepID=A0A834BGR5_9CHIR|nr:testis expressed 53 [Phyllostomus discolor]